MASFNMEGINRRYKDGRASKSVKKKCFKTTRTYSAIKGEYSVFIV